MRLVVVGIGTDVGKTIVSSILVEKFKSNYWKPVQAGELDNSDSHKVARLAASCKQVFPEIHRLNTPASPHYAAALDGVQIHRDDFVLPNVDDLIIEAAGGLLVPLNDAGLLYIDVIQQWKIPVVLVSRHYLGSINHTLLSLEVLKSRGIALFSVVFVGDEHVATESIIQKIYPELNYVRVPNLKELTSEAITAIADAINL